MKRILTFLSVWAILSLTAFGAVMEGQWSFEGSDRTAPKKLSIRVSGTSLSGTMDGTAITQGVVDGAYFWFHVVRSGVDSLYKGQMRAGKIELRESNPQVHRKLSFARSK